MPGLFITFEGADGCGKSTQFDILVRSLRELGHTVRAIREPGGTPIGEEIRRILKHSPASHAMTSEAELLLFNASRAQLARQVIQPAIDAGEIVLCDRFYDSTIAYQGYGRGLDLQKLQTMVDFAVGSTRPDITLLLTVPASVSEARRVKRASTANPERDRFEEADRAFFDRVEQGYQAIAQKEPNRVRVVDGSQSVEAVAGTVWHILVPWIARAHK
jgi:dTMP kinase